MTFFRWAIERYALYTVNALRIVDSSALTAMVIRSYLFPSRHVSSEIAAVRKNFSDSVSVLFKKAIIFSKALARMSIFELNAADFTGSKRILKASEHERFRALDIDLEKIHFAKAFAS